MDGKREAVERKDRERRRTVGEKRERESGGRKNNEDVVKVVGRDLYRGVHVEKEKRRTWKLKPLFNVERERMTKKEYAERLPLDFRRNSRQRHNENM